MSDLISIVKAHNEATISCNEEYDTNSNTLPIITEFKNNIITEGDINRKKINSLKNKLLAGADVNAAINDV